MTLNIPAIDRQRLLQALTIVKPAVPARPSHPILENVLIRVEAGSRVELVATDLEVSIATTIDGTDYVRPGLANGEIAVPAQLLLAALKAVTAETVALAWNPDRQGWIVVTAGDSEFSIPAADPADYPSLSFLAPYRDLGQTPAREQPGPDQDPADQTTPAPKRQVFRRSAATIHRVLSRVLYATAKTDGTPALGCVRLSDDAALACDGHRLARESMAPSDPEVDDSHRLTTPILIPRRAAGIMRDLTKSAPRPILRLIADPGKGLTMIADHILFHCRLLQDQYPDLDHLIRPMPHPLLLSVAALQEALAAANVIADSEHHTITLEIADGRLTISSQQDHTGHARSSIPLDETEHHRQHHLVLNGQYLAEALQAITTEHLHLHLINKPDVPLLLTAADNTALLMPMKG